MEICGVGFFDLGWLAITQNTLSTTQQHAENTQNTLATAYKWLPCGLCVPSYSHI